jgi:hypothetical protein
MREQSSNEHYHSPKNGRPLSTIHVHQHQRNAPLHNDPLENMLLTALHRIKCTAQAGAQQHQV